jgi:Transposase DDE domain
MREEAPQRPGRKPKPKVLDSDVQGGQWIARIMRVLAPLHDHCPDPKRTLHYDEYCAWLLIYFFTPVLTSMRGLQQVSDIEPLRRRFGLPRFSLGSFSEAGNVFDPELLAAVIEEIGQCLGDIETDPRLAGLERRPLAVDGTLIRALPKMVWALWQDEEHRAAKMHLHFDILKGVPERATLTHANASETKELARSLQPGRLYINDRGYFDYVLMAATLAAGSSFVTCVHDDIAYEVLEERPLGQLDTAGRLEADLIVRAGSKMHREVRDRPLRLVRIHVPGPGTARQRQSAKAPLYPHGANNHHTLLLMTDLLDLDASLLALLYCYRWQIELFFRWFKKILQADRLLSLSQEGLTIVTYCGLIASMLVTLWTGRKPTKRTYELLCFYFLGCVGDEDLLRHLDRLEQRQQPR